MAFYKSLPAFSEGYQAWYSEAKALIRQLLPDRLDDFCGYYEKPRGRKRIELESYRISDFLSGLLRRDAQGNTIFGSDAVHRQFQQQLAIFKAIRKRFESSLFNIQQLLQADLYDSELEAAMALVKNGFLRAGGALAGVVLEKHLAQVCESRGVKVLKRNPTIGTYNEALKKAEAIGQPQWRFNEHLNDIRNLCDHHKPKEPTRDEVSDLVKGVMKVIKTLS